MKPFTTLSAVAAPLMRPNVDTDVIIRIERMVGNQIRGTLGRWCLGALRYRADGSEDPDFVLNREPFRQAEILVVGPNFGCGSSREAAVWSLQEFGIKAIVGSGFGDIFYNNCFQNGLLPVVLAPAQVEALAGAVDGGPVVVDLAAGIVHSPSGERYAFAVEERRRQALLLGLDGIDMTLRHRADIENFQRHDREDRPWIHFTGAKA